MKDTRPLFSKLKTLKNGMASLVDAIRKILDKYNTLGQYRILFGTCSCKVVGRKERKKLMIKHRKKTML